MSEKRPLPNLSLSLLERCFARTFQALREAERTSAARELSRIAGSGGVLDLKNFPAYLEERKWPRGRGFIPDLSRLELELKIASLAPDLPTCGFEKVTTATEPEWYSARFRFDPGHRVFESDWPLDQVFANPKCEYEQSPVVLLIHRKDGRTQFRPLGWNEASLLKALQLGVPLGRILERRNGPDFDAMTFHRWMEAGLLRAIDWAPVQNLGSFPT